MSLTKDDFDQIKEIVDGTARTIVNQAILESQKYLKGVIAEGNQAILEKLEEMSTQESEDVAVAYEDIEKLKKRVTKIEQNLKLA